MERQIIKEYLKSGMTAVDIGSNTGVYALFISELVGVKGQVHCFEPSLDNFRHLRKVTKARNNIIINQLAVGSVTGELSLYVSDLANVDHRTYPSDETRESVRVKSIRLDDYDLNGGQVDFIKLDIQGYEYEAFLGMKRTLENNPKVKILSEFWPHGLRAAGRKPEELITLIKDYGFLIYLVDKKRGLLEFSLAGINFSHDSQAYYNIFGSKYPLL